MRSWVRAWASSCWAWFTHSTKWFCHAGYVPEQAGRPRSGSRGRLLASGGVLGGAPLLRCPPPPPAGTAAPAVQCQVTDPRLPELSGLVAVDDQLVAINDGGDQLSV